MAEKIFQMGERKVKIETLVSCVDKEELELASAMHLEQDVVIINQTDEASVHDYGTMKCVRMRERGVGLSRNTAMDYMDKAGGVCLFSDEDIRYDKGYAQAILDEYEAHPEADMILFNMRVNEARRTYWNDSFKRIRFYNYGRYPAYSISAKKSALIKSGVRYSLWFGGGAKYSNGEDSLFLKDCLAAGMKIYASPVCLGEEEERPVTEKASTWFSGYHEKFFHDRGVLYAFLYGPMKYVMTWVFLLRKRKVMCQDIPLLQAVKYMYEGIREADTLPK